MNCRIDYVSRPAPKGFTLVELMIVIAIIAILLSLAMPAYRDFTIRTKVTEGLSIAAGAKVAVSVTCQSDPNVTPSNASTGFGFSSSADGYVQSITVSNTCEEPWIVIRTKNTGATIDVVLSLDGYFDRGEGRILWNCHQVRGEKQHMPGSCRDRHRR
jgi:type IV pilus assembly protein PilA